MDITSLGTNESKVFGIYGVCYFIALQCFMAGTGVRGVVSCSELYEESLLSWAESYTHVVGLVKTSLPFQRFGLTDSGKCKQWRIKYQRFRFWLWYIISIPSSFWERNRKYLGPILRAGSFFQNFGFWIYSAPITNIIVIDIYTQTFPLSNLGTNCTYL